MMTGDVVSYEQTILFLASHHWKRFAESECRCYGSSVVHTSLVKFLFLILVLRNTGKIQGILHHQYILEKKKIYIFFSPIPVFSDIYFQCLYWSKRAESPKINEKYEMPKN